MILTHSYSRLEEPIFVEANQIHIVSYTILAKIPKIFSQIGSKVSYIILANDPVAMGSDPAWLA
jgi:hypothetical protein